MQARIEVDVRQILALLGREGFCAWTHAGHPIQLFVRASMKEARMNVRYRVELRQRQRGAVNAHVVSDAGGEPGGLFDELEVGIAGIEAPDQDQRDCEGDQRGP